MSECETSSEEFTLLLKSLVKRNMRSDAHASGTKHTKSGLNHPCLPVCLCKFSYTDRQDKSTGQLTATGADTRYSVVHRSQLFTVHCTACAFK
jgi:hypothetical protein